ncbi:MerR family transcriptional regulator [uncultured Phascolarctobacterium sp.]|uniref:MerR family transcriptional regulator n=1 Tax=uncultured Phascolarctobacterium sp. TaxID=512296 RepID=UPI0015AC4EEC|nr:MerR family transcriptional regulator [uncultured Phascolarctobacterium sp.]
MTIAEVSKKFGLPADTLRYYERIGLIPPVKRSSSGIRTYDETDCNWVEFIKCMRGVGIPVEMLIEYVAMFNQGADTIGARKELLVEQRQQLALKIVEMQAVLERLDNKIDGYEERCLKFEEENLRK